MPVDTDRKALDDLFSAAYEELRRLAAMVRQGESSATLSPTALVHEAWIKLAASRSIPATSLLHFKRIAARAMRQVLVDAARRRKAIKRGAGAALVTFDEALQAPATTADDVLALEGALASLAEASPRQAAIVECRYFAGLEVAETAVILEISEATVLRDWRAARAWLAQAVRDRA
jgi:RNA polymerase sigma factor (TIGR02999 family)